jgi:hypothetical protein
MPHQRIAGRRGVHAAPGAFQQRHAERGFHAGHPFADRRQRQVHGLCALREAAVFHNRQEQAHIEQIKTHRGLPGFLRFFRTLT